MTKKTTKKLAKPAPAALPRLDARGRECAGGMTAAARRKALAIIADVSKVMRLASVEVTTGQYCTLAVDPTSYVGQDLRDNLPALMSPARPCQVCAQGALFLSFVRVYDKVVTPGFTDVEGIFGMDRYRIEASVMKDELRAVLQQPAACADRECV